MTQLTESAIENFSITLFERLGYSYLYGPNIAPDGDYPERSHYTEVLLLGRLEQALRRINPKLSNDVLHLALKEVQRIQSPGLLANNEAFHRLLTEGVKVSVQQDGSLAPGQPIGNADTRHVEQIHAAGFAAPFHCV